MIDIGSPRFPDSQFLRASPYDVSTEKVVIEVYNRV